MPTESPSQPATAPSDDASRLWLQRLRATGGERDAAVAELHALLLRAARFEIERRRSSLPHLRGGDHEDLAQQSADDALVALLAKLDDFRGESRFTTWAYKFALLEAGVKLRRRTWQGREIPLEAEGWEVLADSAPPAERRAEDRELFDAVREEVERCLSAHQRQVLECFAELDRYVELALSGGLADEQVPGMRAHLDGCPACAEDFESLRDFVAQEPGR